MNHGIGEVAERFKLSAYTLRYYEKEGLIPSVKRSTNGLRMYSDLDMERIQLICCMRSTGMPIASIKQYMDLCMAGDSTIPKRRDIILRQKEAIEDHIREYEGLLAVVNRKLKYYDDMVSANTSAAL